MRSHGRKTKLTRILVRGFLAALVIIGASGLTGQEDQGVTAWGNSKNGLQMALYLGSRQAPTSELPQLNIAFRNLGTSKRKVALGGGCAAGDPTNNVVVLLTDDDGKPHELRDANTSWFCAGAAWVNLITLAPGGYYSTSLDLQNYLTLRGQKERLWHMAKPTGLCRLHAEVELDLKTKAISNELEVRFGPS